jgi:tuberculosinol/isotuberculosinol synthase
MDLQTFLNLPTDEVAALVRASGSKVCVFPINGTRRWFMLEFGDRQWEDPIHAYMDITGKQHITLYKLFFDHGIETLITPVIGPEILATREAYMQKIGAEGLARLATHPDFLNFYDEYGVRARFYGEYRKYLAGTPYEHLSDIFDSLAETTCQHNRFRLFFGAFADNLNATQWAAEQVVQYFQKHGTVPSREQIVAMYYGEYVEKADIFIGFDRFTVFDYPFLNSGEEDLYFTVAPSLYLDKKQLRAIFYDHLYTRRYPKEGYEIISPETREKLSAYYQQNVESVLGTGKLLDNFWVPLNSNLGGARD